MSLSNARRFIRVSGWSLIFLLISFSGVAADTHYLVIGSFDSSQAASQMASKNDLSTTVIETVTQSQVLFRVGVGPFDSLSDVDAAKPNLQQLYPDVWTLSIDQTSDVQKEMAADPIAQADSSLSTQPLVEPTKQTTNRSGARISQRDSIDLKSVNLATTVLNEEIDAIIAPLLGRQVSISEVLKLKEDLNYLFASNGYVNSGVLIPDQKIEDGILNLTFVEGSVSEVHIDSPLSDGYIESRLGLESPFNFQRLQGSLKMLERDPMIHKINANIAPTSTLGVAQLNLAVQTTPKLTASVSLANDRSPAIGSENLDFAIIGQNLTGYGDYLSASTSVTRGLDAYDFLFRIPINRFNHKLSVYYSLSDSSVVEEPFDDIDIESETESAGFTLDIPIVNSLNRQLGAQLIVETRKNVTQLLGQRFSFSEGAIDGESRVTPVRLAVSYAMQESWGTLAIRTAVSYGTSALDVTENADTADADFTSYLIQAQYGRSLSEKVSVSVRALTQIASDPLLSVEKFSIGGVHSVRGYRNNQVVRDDAYLASLEFGYQIRPDTKLLAYYDWGAGENHDDATIQGREKIDSLGVGVIYRGLPGLSAELYLAHGFEEIEVTEHDLQDDGVHIRLNYEYSF